VNIGNIHLNISFFFNLFEEKLEADDGCQVMAKAHIAFGKVS
jgi:hypothetical protein